MTPALATGGDRLPLDFEDFVAEADRLVRERDANAYELGELAVAFKETFSEEGDPTLKDLARMVNISPQRMSEFYHVCAFYPTDVRSEYQDDVAWELMNAARRASNGSLKRAAELLEHARSHYHTVASFRQFLNGVRLETKVRRDQLPDEILMLLPGFESRWFVRFYEDETDD